MLSVDEAIQKIMPFARVLNGGETVSIMHACGRILTQDIVAGCNVPPCHNSAMDGYALRTADLVNSRVLPLADAVFAGDTPAMLPPQSAMRIFTGAPLPDGADAVVIQEETDSNGESVIVQAAVKVGDNIRRCGEDIQRGQLLFAAGHCVRAQDIGLLASVGIANVSVFIRLKVGLLCTGDELQEPGEVLAAGKIYNSNRYMLLALLQQMGCEVVDAGIVQDSLDATHNALEALAEMSDVVLSTGGVSVGDADYVKAAVLALGDLNVWKIAVKPGKPLAFGCVCGKPFFGLPGNPVSAFVTFLLFVRPFLQVEQGSKVRPLWRFQVSAGFNWAEPGKREEYLRVQLQLNTEGVLTAQLYPNQGSGVLSSVCWADALLRVPTGTTFQQGDTVECLLLTM